MSITKDTSQSTNTLVPLGQKLKFFRTRSKLSQLELENRAGLAFGALSRIENGIINPTKETVLKIAEIYGLNNLEIDYLIGQIATPITAEEAQKAREQIRRYFNKTSTLAYLLDERGLFWGFSKGFRILTEMSDSEVESMYGKSMPFLILNDNFGLKRFISPEKYEKVVYESFTRTFADIGFMVGDPYFEETMEYVKTTPFLNKIWQEFEQNGIPEFPTEENRTVYFNYKSREVKMIYTIEPIPMHKRFRVFDFKPSSFILRVLKKFV